MRHGVLSTSTTTIFKNSFESDGTSNLLLMADQIENLCVFSGLHCRKGNWGGIHGCPKIKKRGSARWTQKWLWSCLGRPLNNIAICPYVVDVWRLWLLQWMMQHCCCFSCFDWQMVCSESYRQMGRLQPWKHQDRWLHGGTRSSVLLLEAWQVCHNHLRCT